MEIKRTYRIAFKDDSYNTIHLSDFYTLKEIYEISTLYENKKELSEHFNDLSFKRNDLNPYIIHYKNKEKGLIEKGPPILYKKDEIIIKSPQIIIAKLGSIMLTEKHMAFALEAIEPYRDIPVFKEYIDGVLENLEDSSKSSLYLINLYEKVLIKDKEMNFLPSLRLYLLLKKHENSPYEARAIYELNKEELLDYREFSISQNGTRQI